MPVHTCNNRTGLTYYVLLYPATLPKSPEKDSNKTKQSPGIVTCITSYLSRPVHPPLGSLARGREAQGTRAPARAQGPFGGYHITA